MSEASTIAIDRYAAIQAAVAEGFSLDEVLGAQAMDRREYEGARVRFAVALKDDPTVFDVYARELARAQDAMRRPISPLDDDVVSWLAFSDLAARDADESLQRWELGPNDLARLARHWQSKLSDPEVQRRAREARARGLPPLRHVTAGPKVLLPRAAADAPPPSEMPASSASPARDEALGLTELAAIEAELIERGGQHVRAVVDRFAHQHRMRVEEVAAMREQWRRRIEQDEALGRDFRALVGHHRHRLRLAGSVKRGVETMMYDGAAQGPAVPFVHWRPRLSLEQFAALSVELAYQPARASAILLRYGLDPREKAAHDAHYRRVVEGSPDSRAAWLQAYAAHRRALLAELRRQAIARGGGGER